MRFFIPTLSVSLAVFGGTAAADDKCPNHPRMGFEIPTGSLTMEPAQNGTALRLMVTDYSKDGRQIFTGETTLKLKSGVKVAMATREGWLRVVNGDKLSEPKYGFEGLDKMMPVLELPSVTLEGDQDNDWRLKVAPKWAFSSQDSGVGTTQPYPLVYLPGDSDNDWHLIGGDPTPRYPKKGWIWHLPVLLDLKVNVAASLKRLLPCARGFYWIRVEHPKPKVSPTPRGNGA